MVYFLEVGAGVEARQHSQGQEAEDFSIMCCAEIVIWTGIIVAAAGRAGTGSAARSERTGHSGAETWRQA